VQRAVEEKNVDYTVVWIKNSVAVTTGITSPTLQVVKRADGADLIVQTAMVEIVSGLLTYNATTSDTNERLTKGEAAVAIVAATIDGATRTWRQVVGRDL